jgi:hypothetical protein
VGRAYCAIADKRNGFRGNLLPALFGLGQKLLTCSNTRARTRARGVKGDRTAGEGEPASATIAHHC